MFNCMWGCMSRDGWWFLGFALGGAIVGAAIGAGSLTVSGGFSWPALFIGAGAGAFLGFSFQFGISWMRCWPTCSR